MTYCKRCELIYIHNGGRIEDIKEAEVWVRFADNVLWMVCKRCADEIAYSNRALDLKTPKEHVLRARKNYLERAKHEQ